MTCSCTENSYTQGRAAPLQVAAAAVAALVGLAERVGSVAEWAATVAQAVLVEAWVKAAVERERAAVVEASVAKTVQAAPRDYIVCRQGTSRCSTRRRRLQLRGSTQSGREAAVDWELVAASPRGPRT